MVLIDELGRFYPLLRVSAKVRLLTQICAACCAVFLSGVMIDGISLPSGEFLEF